MYVKMHYLVAITAKRPAYYGKFTSLEEAKKYATFYKVRINDNRPIEIMEVVECENEDGRPGLLRVRIQAPLYLEFDESIILVEEDERGYVPLSGGFIFRLETHRIDDYLHLYEDEDFSDEESDEEPEYASSSDEENSDDSESSDLHSDSESLSAIEFSSEEDEEEDDEDETSDDEEVNTDEESKESKESDNEDKKIDNESVSESSDESSYESD